MPDFPNPVAVGGHQHCFGTPQLLFTEMVVMGTTQTTFEIATGAWPTANLAMFIPLPVSTPFTAAKMFWFNGTAVSGNIDVGIYTSEGTKVVTTGTTAQTGTSAIQSVDITDTLLNPGLYYLAVALDNNTGIVNHFTPSANNCRAIGIRQASSSFVLPTAVTFEAVANAYVPSIYVTGNTVI